MFRAHGEKTGEDSLIKYETPSDTKTHVIPEQESRGLIICRESPHVLTLMVAPLMTCSAYIFSFKTFKGTEKAFISHVTSPGPSQSLCLSIASQLRKETDLSLVSIIIATPGGKERASSIRKDMADISEKHVHSLQNAGLTGKITVLFECDTCEINSNGIFRTYTITDRKTHLADLVFKSRKSVAASHASQDIKPPEVPEHHQSTCLIL